MLNPEEIATHSIPDLIVQHNALYKQRMEAAICSGLGRGAEIAHGIGTIVFFGVGVSGHSVGYAISGLWAVGTVMGHKVHTQSQNTQLESDFDMSVVDSELEKRGFDFDNFNH